MKNNVISSMIWFTLIITSFILFLVGIITLNYLVVFSTVYTGIILFGLLYSVMNSYLVYRKFKYYDIEPKKNFFLIIFPFLIYFLRRDLWKQKLLYYDMLKFVSIIYPLIVSFIISGLITGIVFLGFGLSQIEENSAIAGGIFGVSLASAIVYGWGFIILIIILLFKFLARLKGTQFYSTEQKGFFKGLWETIFLFYYFPKFYYEDLYIYKNKKLVRQNF